jgi:hypothetical protein
MNKNVPCPKCGKINQILNVNKYMGKKVRLVCLNTACNQEIILDLTQEDSDTTVIVHQINRHQGSAELIQMVENKMVKAYPLFKEECIVGRRSQTDPPDIVIQHDPYLSRKQFGIKKQKLAQGEQMYEYMIFGCNAKNKTRINNSYLEAGEKYFLKDGDVIEAGTTTLVFNLKNES